MNDPLAELKAIHTPEAIGFWPPSLALMLLVLGIIITMAAIIYLTLRYKKQTRYQKEAFAQLQVLEQNSTTPKALVQELSQLLRRVAIYHNSKSASLIGDNWQQYLQQFFTKEQAHLLAQARYQKQLTLSSSEQQSLLSNSQKFIKKVRHVSV